MPPTVPKPASAGVGQTALAITKGAWANLRNGPGTNYDDIGDINNNSLVVYYPNTQTSSGWIYVEQGSLGGWVATSVISFEAAVGSINRPTQVPTPYDGKIAVWHWKGDSLPERTIEEFVTNLKRRAPNVKQIWVKTSDGSSWQGQFDTSAMAIKGPSDIDRWVQVLEANGLEFHAWCVPKGVDIDGEAKVISDVCNRPGVRSMILDVEPYAGFWEGGKAGVRPLMVKIRQAVNPSFHIGITIDPRPWHYASIFPDEWYPFINSIHPQAYWHTFRRTPEETLQWTYDTWGKYGRPIIPALQGDAALADQQTAHTLATQKYGATGLSWWRYGVISQWTAVNKPVVITTQPSQPEPTPTYNYVDEVIITPGGTGFRSGTYTGKDEFQRFTGRWGWSVFYTTTEERKSKVWAEWKTILPHSGLYEIATFVPTKHANTNKARFKVHAVKGTDTEVVIDIDQERHKDQWVSLGIFELEKDKPNAGKVFLNDVTGENGKQIAFDAIRWRRIVTTKAPSTSPPSSTPTTPSTPTGPDSIDGVPVANGYDSPVGTDEQRRGTKLWPDGWRDASPFAQLYFKGTPSEAYHTGADLNWGKGPSDDLGQPIYACASGIVIFAAKLPTWGNVIIIRHDPLYVPNGPVMYSRYGHIQNMKVKVGDRVKRGDLIAEVGDAFGRFIPHLHFDISPTTILETKPGDWPARNLNYLLKNYVDPKTFISKNRPK